MEIPILNGIYTNTAGDFRVEYPRNMIPVILDSGISKAYLRPADGIVGLGSGPGIDRGGIEWNNVLYRVMGTKLVSISSTNIVTVIGDVGGEGNVTFDYSFDYLGVASGGKLYLYRPSTGLQQITDVDLGTVIDFVWVDGYFMTTDGEFLVVTELNDPFSVNPLKYGSAEADPDPILALLKVRNEVYALNRHTIEVFDNVGGQLFPFQRVEGAQVQRGTIGTRTCCNFLESVAFIGGGRNEAPSIWLISGSNAARIATREIDLLLTQFTEEELSNALVETRIDKGYKHLYIHLPTQTLVFDAAATEIAGGPVWFTLTTSLIGDLQYQARNLVWAYNRWNIGNPTSVQFGYLNETLSSHWGALNGWQFSTIIIYSGSKGVIFHELELVALTGNSIFGADPSIWTAYTEDGLTWSQERVCKAGLTGVRGKRLSWLQQGRMRQWRAQRFRGTSDAQLSVARLEARVEQLVL
jgi:hypothetical protein